MPRRIDKFYTPRLPLARGKSFDYEYVRNLEDLVKQNLKNILLTIPGERSMDPDFGVGVSTYLFENFGTFEDDLRASISTQIERYAPFVELLSTNIESESDNLLKVQIRYRIPSLSIEDDLSVGATTSKSSGGPKFLV